MRHGLLQGKVRGVFKLFVTKGSVLLEAVQTLCYIYTDIRISVKREDVKSTPVTRCERQSGRGRRRLHRHHTTPHHTWTVLRGGAVRQHTTAAASSVPGCTSPPRLPWGAGPNANSSCLNGKLKVVGTVFQQIMTELNRADSVITRTVLKLMKQNGCI
jgi:hypothetical protein